MRCPTGYVSHLNISAPLSTWIRPIVKHVVRPRPHSTGLYPLQSCDHKPSSHARATTTRSLRTYASILSHSIPTAPNSRLPHTVSRQFSTFAGSSLKAGMVFIHGDKYCEVVSNRQVKQGRGSASIQLEYVELSSKKQMTLNLPIGAKVDKIDLDRQTALVQYLDDDARELVVSDQNYEDARIPAALVGEGAKLLEPGDELQVFYHDRTIVKVGLPNTVASRLK
ncbi:elongation factor [Babesia caballi]|uniref:Elongation factor n=1 Tax=Babesia caballi TaxID=5871 RepID=A0AAV4M0G2_BABCB|nr:elongation factor [Babesia caballi]